jgi:hypothetical protein
MALPPLALEVPEVLARLVVTTMTFTAELARDD